MATKLENIIYKTYQGGIGGGEGDASDDEDISTVNSDTSEVNHGGDVDEAESDGDEGSVAMGSDDDAEVDADDSDIESDDGEQGIKSLKKPQNEDIEMGSDMDADTESDSDSDDEDYLQKLDDSVRRNIISENHPEMIQHNDEEVETLCKIVKDADGVIIDPFHKTLPFVTKYEKARILGERAKQINAGAKPFVAIEKHMIDGYLIALREFEEKKIPFIIRRPLPNGGSEYWKLADLQILD